MGFVFRTGLCPAAIKINHIVIFLTALTVALIFSSRGSIEIALRGNSVMHLRWRFGVGMEMQLPMCIFWGN